MRVAINFSLKPLAPRGISHANPEEEQGCSDIDEVGVAETEDDHGGEQRHDAFDEGSFIHNDLFFCRSDQGGKGEEKFTALPLLAFHADVSAVGENDLPGDAQAEAGAFVAAFGHAEEFVENSPP